MKPHKPSKIEKKLAKLLFSYQQRTGFYDQLIALIETGMNQTDAIQMAWKTASEEGKKPKETLAIILHDIIQSKKNGSTLGQAMKPWAPQEDVMVLEAIENSTDFAGNLRSYLEMLEKKRKIKSTIILGSLYPIVLISVLFGIMTYFGKEVVPTIAEMHPIEKWYGPAAFLRFINAFAMNYITPTVLFLVTTLSLIVFSFPRWVGGGRIIADKFPLYSIYRMYTGISFLMSMSMLIQGGMPASQALDRLRPSASPYVAYRILKIRNQLLNGNNFGGALHRAGTGWPDRKMNLSIKIYAESQDLSAQLTKLSKRWINQSQENITSAMGTVRSLAMLAVAGTLLGIVAGVFALQGQITTSLR
ncbi:type II secretion system F family protein [Leisingera sp. XS_AS12]|uniref:type II secretion system F family protein n=1 Tax=Leisingera sp. XS_AS12 TaxID=3241294 RepID=UPI0035180AEE